jgi:hypothetical protein
MQLQTKLQKKTVIIHLIFSLLAISILHSCGDNPEPGEIATATDKPDSFTFFELGTNTRLSERIRKDLGNKLGRDAIERRSILNLDTNYAGFIKKYLPKIDQLNRKINYPPGERVEHDTVKLMYRYSQRKNAPFDYVELVFSEHAKTPLLIKVNFRKDDTGIVETLKTKYGPPQIIEWKQENGKSMVWRKNTDVLLVSLVPDQLGQHEYQIVIYFVQNLNQLIEHEKMERIRKEKQRSESGKTAF